ncbi:hypothetical protein SODG_006267 [Sodalis praecaptivus]
MVILNAKGNFYEKTVLTPFGRIEEDKVIHLENSMRIEISDKMHLISVCNDSGRIINDYGEASSNTLPNFKEDNYPGYTVFADASNIKSFKTTWIVPEKPQLEDSGDTFFIWNGLSCGALQPVLTWGNGESAYRIINWAFVGGKYVYGNYISVNPGDTITGIISLQKIESGKWHYLLSFDGYPDADFMVARDTEAQGVIQCFESYTTEMDRISSSQFCSMKNIHLEVTEGAPLPEEFNWQVTGGTPVPIPSEKTLSLWIVVR